MALKISIRIKFYNGIERFLCHSTAFLYTSATVRMLMKLHTVRWFSRQWHKITAIAENHGTWPKSRCISNQQVFVFRVANVGMNADVKCQCQKWIYIAHSRGKPLMRWTHRYCENKNAFSDSLLCYPIIITSLLLVWTTLYNLCDNTTNDALVVEALWHYWCANVCDNHALNNYTPLGSSSLCMDETSYTRVVLNAERRQLDRPCYRRVCSSVCLSSHRWRRQVRSARDQHVTPGRV